MYRKQADRPHYPETVKDPQPIQLPPKIIEQLTINGLMNKKEERIPVLVAVAIIVIASLIFAFTFSMLS